MKLWVLISVSSSAVSREQHLLGEGELVEEGGGEPGGGARRQQGPGGHPSALADGHRQGDPEVPGGSSSPVEGGVPHGGQAVDHHPSVQACRSRAAHTGHGASASAWSLEPTPASVQLCSRKQP